MNIHFVPERGYVRNLVEKTSTFFGYTVSNLSDRLHLNDEDTGLTREDIQKYCKNSFCFKEGPVKDSLKEALIEDFLQNLLYANAQLDAETEMPFLEWLCDTNDPEIAYQMAMALKSKKFGNTEDVLQRNKKGIIEILKQLRSAGNEDLFNEVFNANDPIGSLAAFANNRGLLNSYLSKKYSELFKIIFQKGSPGLLQANGWNEYFLEQFLPASNHLLFEKLIENASENPCLVQILRDSCLLKEYIAGSNKERLNEFFTDPFVKENYELFIKNFKLAEEFLYEGVSAIQECKNCLENNIPLSKDLVEIFGTKKPLEGFNEKVYRAKRDNAFNAPEVQSMAFYPISSAILLAYQTFLKNKEDEILEKIPQKLYANRTQLSQYFADHLATCKSDERYVYEKLLAQSQVWKSMEEIECFKGVSFKMVTHFLIDRNLPPERQQLKDYAFENEPGTILGMLKGFQFALETRKNPKDREWWMHLHAKCFEGVRTMRHSPEGVPLLKFREIGSNFRAVPGFLSMKNYDSSPEGLNYLRNRSIGDESEYRQKRNVEASEGNLKHIDPSLTPGKSVFFCFEAPNSPFNNDLHYFPWSKGFFEKFCNRIFQIYQESLQKSQTPAERLLCYLCLSHELEINHFFEDGNNRTMLLTLYSSLAADEELPMLLYPEPNVFDFNDLEKIVYRTLEAADYFKSAVRSQKESTELSASREDKQGRKLKDFSSPYRDTNALKDQLVKHLPQYKSIYS